VAVALECHREGTPCKILRAHTADARVARVFPAHLAKLQLGWGRYDQDNNVSTLALVGVAPGETSLRLEAEGWSQEYQVTVLAVTGDRPSARGR
jgi:hypothetical protein